MADSQSLFAALLAGKPVSQVANQVIGGSNFNPNQQPSAPAPAAPAAPGAGPILQQSEPPMTQGAGSGAPNLSPEAMKAFSQSFRSVK